MEVTVSAILFGFPKLKGDSQFLQNIWYFFKCTIISVFSLFFQFFSRALEL